MPYSNIAELDVNLADFLYRDLEFDELTYNNLGTAFEYLCRGAFEPDRLLISLVDLEKLEEECRTAFHIQEFLQFRSAIVIKREDLDKGEIYFLNTRKKNDNFYNAHIIFGE